MQGVGAARTAVAGGRPGMAAPSPSIGPIPGARDVPLSIEGRAFEISLSPNATATSTPCAYQSPIGGTGIIRRSSSRHDHWPHQLDEGPPATRPAVRTGNTHCGPSPNDSSALPLASFWAEKRVLLTGHTGFKGSWAALWLTRMGARVTGLALPAANPSLHALVGVDKAVDSRIVDLRDVDGVAAVARTCSPEIVLHMAAQPLVRRSLLDPVETFAVNVMGTLHLMQALRVVPPPRAVLIVTTDKVYVPADRTLRESDPLGGGDPYAASKAACELAVRAMAANFLAPAGIPVATARAGNVIGGGDFASDRLIPDIIRAERAGRTVEIRHPGATRPWQHVLDCLCGYLLYAEALAIGRTVPATLNFGPSDASSVTVAAIARSMLTALGREPSWTDADPDMRETQALALDSSLARQSLRWRDRLAGPSLIKATAAWYRAWNEGQDMRAVSLNQIAEYEAMP